MAYMGVYLAFDVDYISMIPTGGELVACRHSVKVDDEDLAGAYELIRKLYQEVRIERDNLKQENAKLREERDHWRVEQVHAYGNWEDTYKRASELEAENVKLRELCADMMEFFEDGDWCVKCECARDCQEQEQYEDECLMRFVFRDRMRELGVEVK